MDCAGNVQWSRFHNFTDSFLVHQVHKCVQASLSALSIRCTTFLCPPVSQFSLCLQPAIVLFLI